MVSDAFAAVDNRGELGRGAQNGEWLGPLSHMLQVNV